MRSTNDAVAVPSVEDETDAEVKVVSVDEVTLPAYRAKRRI